MVEIGEKVKITWSGFGRKYDCEVDLDKLRLPVDERLLSRNAITAGKFSKSRHPRNLCLGDGIFDAVV